MYIPRSFAVADQPRLHDFIESHSFGLLVSQVADRPFATHLPMLLERDAGPHGAIVGHFARANPHWRDASGPALAVFSGPHAYISPRWYAAELTVPTWNYVAVHASGPLEIIEDRAALLEIVTQMVAVYEAGRPDPWPMVDNAEFVDNMLRQIVGFRLPIEQLKGKWKLNQNHPVERRERVVRALRQDPREDAQAIARLMEESLQASPER
jgi:transcriptional regulator